MRRKLMEKYSIKHLQDTLNMVKEVVNLYQLGVTVKAISIRFKCSRNVIYKILKDNKEIKNETN